MSTTEDASRTAAEIAPIREGLDVQKTSESHALIIFGGSGTSPPH